MTRVAGGGNILVPGADHPGFLRAILDDPLSSSLRLIFADWLEEEGQGARAEFIRVQCEAARLLDSGAVTSHEILEHPLQARMMELCRQYPNMPVPTPLRHLLRDMTDVLWHSRRGFVERISTTQYSFLENAEELASLTPLLQVQLSDREPEPFPNGKGDDGFIWQEDHPQTGVARGYPWLIDRRLWRRLRPGSRDNPGIAIYQTIPDAQNDLSRACVDHARKLARLPAIKWKKAKKARGTKVRKVRRKT